jgi:hypothetical protein
MTPRYNSQKVSAPAKKQMGAAVLVPGLRVTVEGVGDAQSRVTPNP